MQRGPSNANSEPRRGAEKNAAQPISGEDRTDENEDDVQEPDAVPSFLTAKEFQAKDPKANRSLPTNRKDESPEPDDE